jgi:hypothetical protein
MTVAQLPATRPGWFTAVNFTLNSEQNLDLMNSNVSPPNPGYPQSQPGSSGSMADSARETGQELKSKTSEAAHNVKERASGVAQELKHRASEAVDERKREVASRIRGYSSAIREAGKNVEQDDPNIAWFTEEAAKRLQSVADYIRQRDFNGLRVDAENFARRHPAVMLGGMFVTGLLLGMEEADDQERWDYNYDPELSPGESMTSTSPIVPESSEI